MNRLVEAVNRGGLWEPTELAFGVALKCWEVFACIRKTPDLNGQFLRSSNHQQLFTGVVMRLLESERELEGVMVTRLECDGGHSCEELVTKMFNCMAANMVKELSQAVNEAKMVRREMKMNKNR